MLSFVLPAVLSLGRLYNSTFWTLGDELAGQINKLETLAKNMFRVLINVALAGHCQATPTEL